MEKPQRKVVILAKESISVEAYARPWDYLETMKSIAKLEYQVSEELEGQIQPSILNKYKETVKTLIDSINDISNTPNQHSFHNILWDEVERVAELQLQICEIVIQMLK